MTLIIFLLKKILIRTNKPDFFFLNSKISVSMNYVIVFNLAYQLTALISFEI
jgi:hypothetical protein